MILVAVLAAGAAAAGVFTHGRLPHDRADRLARGALFVIVWLLSPVITFVNVIRLHADGHVFAGVAFGGVAVLVSLGVAYLVGSRLLGLGRRSVGALMVASAFGNTGFLGLPVVTALFGGGQLGPAIVYDLVLTSVGIFTVGFLVGATFGGDGEGWLERLRPLATRNPPVWAAIAGVLAPSVLAPDWAVDASHVLVYFLPVLGFFVVGLTLAAESDEDALAFPPPLTRPVMTAVALKLLLVPAVFLMLAAVLGPVPKSFGVEAAMATAINTLAIANQFGLDRALVASAIAWSTTLVLVVGLAASFF